MNEEYWHLALILMSNHHIKLEKEYLSVITWSKQDDILQLIGDKYYISKTFETSTGYQYIIKVK